MNLLQKKKLSPSRHTRSISDYWMTYTVQTCVLHKTLLKIEPKYSKEFQERIPKKKKIMLNVLFLEYSDLCELIVLLKTKRL
jgi:hypothetical protein